jgi:hypothetical protein
MNSDRRLSMNHYVAQASCLRVRRASLPGEVTRDKDAAAHELEP